MDNLLETYSPLKLTQEERQILNVDNKERYLISKDYYSNHKEVIDEKIKEKVEIIIEAFDGLVLDRNIADES